MKTVVQCIRERDAIAAIAREWDALVHEEPHGFGGLDATATSVWFEALCSTFVQAASPMVLVARDESGRLRGLLPLVPLSQDRLGAVLGPPTELHGGRCAPLLDSQCADDVLQALLHATLNLTPAWTKLRFTVPEGVHLDSLRVASANLGWHSRDTLAAETSGFALPSNAADLNVLIPAKMRQNLRTASNKLSKLALHGEVREFSTEQQAEELLTTMLEIELGSWKHEAGTAITRHPIQQAFYAALFPRAMGAGQLLGLTMEIDGQPIAYVVGVMRNNVFCCLKHSQLQSRDALSPSSLLMQELLLRLVQRGVRRFDWMGLLEPHKLRWSADNLTYRRRTVWLHNPGWRGRIQGLLSRVGETVLQLRKSSSGSANPHIARSSAGLDANAPPTAPQYCIASFTGSRVACAKDLIGRNKPPHPLEHDRAKGYGDCGTAT